MGRIMTRNWIVERAISNELGLANGSPRSAAAAIRTTGVQGTFRTSAVIAALLAMLAGLTGCSLFDSEARLLLRDIVAGPQPSMLKASTPAPQRTAVSWTIDGRPGRGDLYTSGPGPHARLVLVPGLSPQGKDDPRLMALAHTLARVHFAVLVPDLVSVRALRVAPSDARHIADAVRFLSAEAVTGSDTGPVGMAAISYAVGPAVLAALEPDAATQIAFIVGVGGYYDMQTVLTYATTGRYRDEGDGPWHTGRPDPAAKWRFAYGNADRMSSIDDQQILRDMARRRLYEPGTPIDDLASALGPEGRSVLALLDNRDPDAVPDLIAGLPEALRSDLEGLSLARRDLSTLEAHLHLVHGSNDPMVPVSESRRLAAAVPDQSTLYVVDQLDHVDLDGDLGFIDQWTLMRAATTILSERDRALGQP